MVWTRSLAGSIYNRITLPEGVIDWRTWWCVMCQRGNNGYSTRGNVLQNRGLNKCASFFQKWSMQIWLHGVSAGSTYLQWIEIYDQRVEWPATRISGVDTVIWKQSRVPADDDDELPRNALWKPNENGEEERQPELVSTLVDKVFLKKKWCVGWGSSWLTDLLSGLVVQCFSKESLIVQLFLEWALSSPNPY